MNIWFNMLSLGNYVLVYEYLCMLFVFGLCLECIACFDIRDDIRDDML